MGPTLSTCSTEIPDNQTVLNCYIPFTPWELKSTDGIISVLKKMRNLRNVEFNLNMVWGFGIDIVILSLNFAYEIRKAFATKQAEIVIEFSEIKMNNYPREVVLDCSMYVPRKDTLSDEKIIFKKQGQKKPKFSGEVIKITLHSRRPTIRSKASWLDALNEALAKSNLKDHYIYISKNVHQSKQEQHKFIDRISLLSFD